MLSFLSVAILVYGSMNLYLFGKAWLALPHSPALGVALVLAGSVMTCSPLLVWYMDRHGWRSATVATAWVSYTWMGYLFLFFCIGLLLDLGHMLAAALDLHWPLGNMPAFALAGLLALAALAYGFFEARSIRVERVNVATPKLASGQVTLAQISDLHLGLMQGGPFLDRVVTILRELKPDIVVATGDIVDGQSDDLDALARRFNNYLSTRTAYAVVGNHETYAGLANSLRFLRESGFTVLRGDAARADGITLVGVDDPSAANAMPHVPRNTARARIPIDTHEFIVLLKHQPVVDREMPFDLQLSGHIHGGQIFPFGYLTRLVYGVDTGLTPLPGGGLLYVSRGTGTWGPPIRLLAAPEITLITIRSADK